MSYKEYIICVCIRVCLSVCLYVCFAITIDIICLCVALAITSGDSSLPLVKVRRGTNFQTKGKRGWCSKAGFLVSLEFQLFLSVSVWLRCRSLLKGTKLPSSQCTLKVLCTALNHLDHLRLVNVLDINKTPKESKHPLRKGMSTKMERKGSIS